MTPHHAQSPFELVSSYLAIYWVTTNPQSKATIAEILIV
jgi:hypothetical protein